jgi:hypothetical protein
MENLQIFSKIPASAEFNGAFSNANSHTTIQCEFCGRKHFVNEASSDVGHYDEGEYDILISANKANPDSCVMSDTAIAYGYLDGKAYVSVCPCNAGYTYEFFMLNNRDGMRDYFVSMKGKAEQRMREFDSVANAINDGL